MNFKGWIHGLLAALIGGGATGATAGITGMGLDPQHFNLQGGFWQTMELAGATFILSGLFNAFAYLKQSPLPDWDGATERRANADGK